MHATHRRMLAALEPVELQRERIHWVAVGPAERALLGEKARKALTDPGRFELEVIVGTGGEERRLYRVLR